MIIQRNIDTYCGLYDFAVTGGAIGSYDLQIPIPQNFVIEEFYAVALIAPTSGVGQMISFDAINTSVSPNATIIGQFMPATLVVGGLTFVPFVPMYGVSGGLQELNIDFANVNALIPSTRFAPSIMTVFNMSIGMSISGAPLFAGKIIVAARGTAFDLP